MIFRDAYLPDEWAKKTGAKIKKENCPDCSKELVVNIPYESKKAYGFASEKCCNEKRFFSFAFKDESLNQKMIEVLNKRG